MTAGELAFLIILACGATKKNFDNDEVQYCVNKINNCAVTGAGEIKREKANECVTKYRKI